jgi:N-acetylglucosamine-6-phosphate deacetylase
MTSITHRAPGLAGAVLSHEAITAELICDGFHVHPAMCRLAIAAKSVDGVMAITDGTAGAGLSAGSLTRLGGGRFASRIRRRCLKTARWREAH